MLAKLLEIRALPPAPIYFATSLFILLLNKLLIARFFFDYPTVILMFQSAGLLFAIELARMLNLFKLAPYTFDRGKDMLAISILHSLHMYFSLTSFEGMSLPMFGTIKRLLPLVLVALSTSVLKRPLPSRRSLCIISVVVFGSALATTYEFTLDWWSNLYGSIHVALGASYMILVERLAATKNYSLLDIIYMNSFNNLVFFLIADMVQDEIRDAFMYFLTSGSILFWWCLFGQWILGIILQISFFSLILQQSSLEVSILNAAKVTLQTLIVWLTNFFLLYDIVPTSYNVIGCFICFAGNILYSLNKRTEVGTTKLTPPRRTLL